uniref:Matrix-remodelling associated 5b n=1 Tax=Cyprinus carpio TaxID=7962 RepID=A0A8C2F8K3_CYPCA
KTAIVTFHWFKLIHLFPYTLFSTGAVMSANTRVQRFEVQSNGTFVIHNIQLQDRGQYLCSARNPHGIDKMMVTLVVLAHAPKMMLSRHKDMTVYLGNSALLECQAQGLPVPNISWVLPDRSVVRAVSNSQQKVVLFTNGTLQVKNTNYLDKGIYKCIASNAAGADMLSVRLQIAALPPTIQEQLRENHTIYDGQSAFIHCTAKGTPGPTIRWVTFTGAQLRPSQFVNGNLLVFPNGTLFIRNPTVKDSGNYECVAVNSVGVAKRTVNLQVKRSSTTARIMSTSAHSTDVRYGGQLSLNCSATGKITWSLPDGTMVNGIPQSDHNWVHTKRYVMFDNGTLYLNEVGMKEEGDYTCYAENRIGKDEMKVHIKVVADAPIIRNNVYSVVKVHFGETVILNCSAKGEPTPTITWTSPAHRAIVPLSNKYHIANDGTLHIQKIQRFDSGNYTCSARNVAGIDKKVIHIEVLVSTPVINGLESQGVIRKTVVKDQRVLLDFVEKHQLYLTHFTMIKLIGDALQ